MTLLHEFQEGFFSFCFNLLKLPVKHNSSCNQILRMSCFQRANIWIVYNSGTQFTCFVIFIFNLFTTGGAVGIALACLAIGAIVGAIVMFVIQKKFPNGFRNRDGYLNPVFDDSSRYWHTDRQTYVVLLIFYTHVYLYCIVLSTNKSCLFLYKLQYESLSSVRQSEEE